MTLKHKSQLFLIVISFGTLLSFLAQHPSQKPSARMRVVVNWKGSAQKLLAEKIREIQLPETKDKTWRLLEQKAEPLSLKVTRLQNQPILEIEVYGPAKNRSKQFLNAFAKVLADEDLENQLKEHQKQINILQKNLLTTGEKIKGLEEALSVLRAQNKPEDVRVDQTLQIKLNESQARYQQLSAIYKENHPDMKELSQKIASLSAQLADSPIKANEKLIRQKEVTLGDLLKKEAFLRAQLEDLELRLHTLSPRIAPLQYPS